MVPVIVILLIIGCVFLLASFLFKDAFSDDSKRKIMTETEIEQLVERRFSEVKYRLDDEAEKSADVIRDQTERELEKLSNEKIMAVNEYSDQVMDQINKNHNEVMFLYSMLSDKQKELDHAVESLNQIRQQAENEKKLSERARMEKESAQTVVEQSGQLSFEDLPQTNGEAEGMVEQQSGMSAENLPETTKVRQGISGEKYTNKEIILQMHKEGYSSLEIAQQLQLGVGEVRLVIGLSKERQE